MASNSIIYARFIAAGSGSNQILQACLTAGSSSQDAYETAYPPTSTANFAYNNQTYLSSATPTSSVFNPDLYNAGSASKAINRNNANFAYQYTTPLLIPADTTLDAIINGRIAVDVDLSHIADASVSPTLNTISATQFGTTYSNGNVWVIGDDSKLVDVNLGNGFGIVGQQQINRGWVKFGTNGPVWGHNGNQSTLPTPGDGLYALTGSLIVSSSKLMYYNGSATTNGWTAIK
jgi:hypothetical protein